MIGRDSEVAEIETALRKYRLVTLTGMGGVGKTRLSMEVARQLVNEFPDGVWFLELAAVTDPSAVPDAVAAVLGITQQPGKTMSESVAEASSGRVRLLVIDNCEHVRDAAANLIEGILTQSTTVTILATSRERLGLVDEQLWPVRPLDVDAGIDSAAVALFIERARSVTPRFSLPPESNETVFEICRRLDGIPLAIELAASRMASMTVGEVLDRLDQRFRLLVGSRRGLARHQTLHQAVAWSYDHLADAEKILLERCSVFAGGFDLQSACAVIESEDDFATLDLLDKLVHKSLLVADRTSDRTRYSMLETIRQFAEEQLIARGDSAEARTAHARHFAGREAEILALWDSPRQREAYEWFAVELANLRKAFRWAADQADLDAAIAIATYVMFLGSATESYEPIAWAEELVEPARAVDHPALATLYVMASQCWMPGRIEAAVRYCDAGQTVIANSRGTIPFGVEGWLGSSYLFIGQPQRWVDWCRAQLARGSDTHTLTRTCLVMALTVAGPAEEAMVAANGLVAAAETTRNPYAISFACFVHGLAFRDVDPRGALDILRRGLAIARDSGNRFNETQTAVALSRLEATCGDPLAALDYIGLAIHRYLDAGNALNMRVAQAELVGLFHRLGRHEPAATIAGSALSPLTSSLPEFTATIADLREVLGDQTYELLARKGEAMTTAAMASYAYDQIDQAREEGGAVS